MVFSQVYYIPVCDFLLLRDGSIAVLNFWQDGTKKLISLFLSTILYLQTHVVILLASSLQYFTTASWEPGAFRVLRTRIKALSNKKRWENANELLIIRPPFHLYLIRTINSFWIQAGNNQPSLSYCSRNHELTFPVCALAVVWRADEQWGE